MVIAALVVFVALLAAWLVAPGERTGMKRTAEHPSAVVPSAPAEGLPEAA